MSEREQFDELPLLPIYMQTAPNETIDLGSIRIKPLEGNANNSESSARIAFTPEDQLEFLLPRRDGFSALKHAFGIDHSSVYEKLDFIDHQTAADVFFVGHWDDFEVFLPTQTPVKIRRDPSLITRTIFHLMNWPQSRGPDSVVLRTGAEPNYGGRVSGRIILRSNGWVITIYELEKIEELLKALQTHGGHVITHVGEIRREDGANYTAEECEECMDVLHYFFSFAQARWAGPVLPVGMGPEDERVFEDWGIGLLTDGVWKADRSWTDKRRDELLSQVLPGFWQLSTNPTWIKPLKDVIYWYVGASSIGRGVNVDSALLLTQAALELLAWTYCVVDRRMVSKNAFRTRGLSAADKFRIMASSLNIPLEIPPSLTALHARAGTKWGDSMEALTDIRNGLVHPGSEKKIPDGAYYDAWRLSLWYIDMIVLRLCGHMGQYANRLRSSRWVGHLDYVPWVSVPPKQDPKSEVSSKADNGQEGN